MTRLVQNASGYILLTARGCPALKVTVSTADQASAALQQYRDENGLGASDFKRGCGDVFDLSGVKVAHVSYNGRVWDAQGERLLQEAW